MDQPVFDSTLVTHLCISSFIALVVLAPLAAGDSCQYNFTNMFGVVTISRYPKPPPDFTVQRFLRPIDPLFEVDFELGRARFYPIDDNYRDNSVYIQDLKTNMMYIYPYENGRPTGKCTKVAMPKKLMVPSCLPYGWINSTPDDMQRWSFSPDGKGLFQGGDTIYDVRSHDPSKVVRIYNRLISQDNSSIIIELRVNFHTLDLTKKPSRFSPGFDNCVKEDLLNLFS